MADTEFRFRSKELAKFRITAYQEWQVEGEIMIGRQSVQDEVQEVGRVKITAYQEWQVVGEIMIGRQSVQDEVQGVGIVQNNSSPAVAGSG